MPDFDPRLMIVCWMLYATKTRMKLRGNHGRHSKYNNPISNIIIIIMSRSHAAIGATLHY
jgi:hypothetical protein